MLLKKIAQGSPFEKKNRTPALKIDLSAVHSSVRKKKHCWEEKSKNENKNQ